MRNDLLTCSNEECGHKFNLLHNGTCTKCGSLSELKHIGKANRDKTIKVTLKDRLKRVYKKLTNSEEQKKKVKKNESS